MIRREILLEAYYNDVTLPLNIYKEIYVTYMHYKVLKHLYRSFTGNPNQM